MLVVTPSFVVAGVLWLDLPCDTSGLRFDWGPGVFSAGLAVGDDEALAEPWPPLRGGRLYDNLSIFVAAGLVLLEYSPS